MSTLPAEIKCLFFSEFDPIAGPKISCQVLELVIWTRSIMSNDICCVDELPIQMQVDFAMSQTIRAIVSTQSCVLLEAGIETGCKVMFVDVIII